MERVESDTHGERERLMFMFPNSFRIACLIQLSSRLARNVQTSLPPMLCHMDWKPFRKLFSRFMALNAGNPHSATIR